MSFDQLKKRAQLILGSHPLTSEEIQQVEEVLNVKFSQDFIELNKVCSYEYSHFVDFFNFGRTDFNSVINATLGLRGTFQNAGAYVDLYSDDVGIILINGSDKKSSVIWCSIYDLDNLFNDRALKHKHQFFPTFTDFFVYLLDEEEKHRAEIQPK